MSGGPERAVYTTVRISSRVRSAAGISRQPVLFCPDHNGEKSPRPSVSAFARNAARAADASGRVGSRIGPVPASAG